MAPQGQRAHWAASTRSPPALDDASVTALARGLSARFASCSGGSKEVERQQFGYRVTIVQARRSPPDRRGCLRHGGARVRERHAATGCGFRQRSTHKERHEPARMVKRPLTRIAYPRAWVPASPSPHGDRARPFPPTCDHGPPWTLWSHRRPRSQLFASAELALGDARKARLPRVETGAGSPRPEGGLSKLERAVSIMLSPLGTESSNPSPSSRESTNFRFLSRPLADDRSGSSKAGEVRSDARRAERLSASAQSVGGFGRFRGSLDHPCRAGRIARRRAAPIDRCVL